MISDAVDQYLRRTGLTAARVVPLAGDASTRRYFRVARPDGTSIVLAVYPEPFSYAALPFVNVSELFTAIPVPIPAILGHAGDLGVLALQDLGDLTLQAHLGAAPAAAHATLYREAVGYLARLQDRGRELADARYLPFGLAFDVEKLRWELEFFLTHFVEGYRGAALAPAARGAFGEEFDALARGLADEPRVLCHRDYHSRNLMLFERRLFVIDYQDARMGPETYDLASLLRDAYVDVEPARVDELLAYFLALAGRPLETAGAFRERFDVMVLQRTLKALGTFGYQATVRGNPTYLQYMPRTLRYARDPLTKYPRFCRLRDLLAAHLEELR